jgi:hypothetical protein
MSAVSANAVVGELSGEPAARRRRRKVRER